MGKPFSKGLFLFRRDLRLHDNTALRNAAEQCDQVVAGFIFDPRQVGSNPYRGDHSIQFMVKSLGELEREVEKAGGKLHYFWGEAHQVVESLLRSSELDAIFFNRDYTPFSRNRDRAIREICERYGRKAIQYDDALLHEPELLKSGKGTPYSVYTPFYRAASKLPVRCSAAFHRGEFYSLPSSLTLSEALLKFSCSSCDMLFRQGGRTEALEILSRISDYAKHSEERDFPALQATTGLSPHLKFGTVSAREVYEKVTSLLGSEHTLIRELFWRDFFTHIAFHFPHVFKGAFHSHFDLIEWENDEALFKKWCEGETGFPIVDAGMRELNATGFMHNRVRMIVASFLTKDLLIDWRWGERYFAQKLLDYDPAVNNGNWQWAASTGCDAQPYFRIFNPWLQQERFDAEGDYIKRWVPELSQLAGKTLHTLHEDFPPALHYPKPVVVHAEQKKRAERMFSEAAARKLKPSP